MGNLRKVGKSATVGKKTISFPMRAFVVHMGSRMNNVEISCAEFESRLAETLDRVHLPPEAQLHLSRCGVCAAMVADFDRIAERVRALAESEPVPDLWPEIREKLLQEGIIHDSAANCPSTPAPRLVHNATTSRRA